MVTLWPACANRKAIVIPSIPPPIIAHVFFSGILKNH
jgi:hypothetical protein